MEQSVWTWIAADGQQYQPGRIPTLWRRIVDRTPEECTGWLGPAAWLPVGGHASAEPLSSWGSLHALLGKVATLWQPLAGSEGLEHLATAGWQPVAPWALFELQNALSVMVRAKEFEVRLSADRLDVEAVPLTLRAHLIQRCAYDVRVAVRHHRCAWCNEWHPVFRSGARFCSSICRNEAHRAGQATPAEANGSEGL
jgi:hypothetical protein